MYFKNKERSNHNFQFWKSLSKIQNIFRYSLFFGDKQILKLKDALRELLLFLRKGLRQIALFTEQESMMFRVKQSKAELSSESLKSQSIIIGRISEPSSLRSTESQSPILVYYQSIFFSKYVQNELFW